MELTEDTTKMILTAYLCGPINGCSDAEAIDWREDFKRRYHGPVRDPMRRDFRGREGEFYREVVELDKRDVRASGVLVARYVKPSIGTAMEIFYAHALGIPVVLWCDDTVDISPWLRYHSTRIVHSVQDAISAAHWFGK